MARGCLRIHLPRSGSSALLVLFQLILICSTVHIRKRYLGWWQKYNYVLTSALTCGIAIAAVVTFFALQWAGIEINWRGNTIVDEGCDGTGCPRFAVPEKGYWVSRRVRCHWEKVADVLESCRAPALESSIKHSRKGAYVRLEVMYMYAHLKYESSFVQSRNDIITREDKRNKLGQERPIKNDYVGPNVGGNSCYIIRVSGKNV